MNKKDMFIKEKLQQDKEISDKANKIFDNIKEEFKLENNEKKTVKISFNTFLAIAASLVIVGFVGVNIYANSLGKPNVISGIQALIRKEEKENTDEIAKELFEKGAEEIRRLQYAGLIKEEYEVEGDLIEKEINGRIYVKTNEKYEKVEQKYGEIFTDKALENVLSKRFANVDGILYISYGGATGWGITNVEVEKINEKDGELTYRASYNDMGIEGFIDEKRQTCEFKIRKVNEAYRISETNYLNLDKEEIDNSKELGSEEAKKTMQGYLNIFGAKFGSPARVLTTDEIKLISSYSEIDGKADKNNYISSKIKYSDFKNKMLEYMTEKLFEEMSGSNYKNVNGMLYIADIGASGKSFKIEEIELISEEDDKCKYRIKGLEFEGGQKYDFIGEVELQKNKKNKYVVSKFEWEEKEDEKSKDDDYNNTNTNDNNSTTNIKNNNTQILGDVNCDGVVNGKDLVSLRKYVDSNEQNLTEQGKINADVNDDGTVTNADVNILEKYLAGVYNRLPQRTSGEELISKVVPGMSIKYPKDWIVEEIDKGTWGNRTGKATCIFKGTVNNIGVTVTTYDPLFGVGEYKNLIKKECLRYGIGYYNGLEKNGYNVESNSKEHLDWRSLYISSELRCYYHIIDKNVDNSLKIEVKIDNPTGENQLPVERIIDDIILGTTVRSY